jgi:hypothetical protein
MARPTFSYKCNDAVPTYAKVRAAATLLGADEAASAGEIEGDSDTLRSCIVQPDDGRNATYGLYSETQAVVIVPQGWPMDIQPESHHVDAVRRGLLSIAR